MTSSLGRGGDVISEHCQQAESQLTMEGKGATPDSSLHSSGLRLNHFVLFLCVSLLNWANQHARKMLWGWATLFSSVYLLKKAGNGCKWLTRRFYEQKEAQLSLLFRGQKNPHSQFGRLGFCLSAKMQFFGLNKSDSTFLIERKWWGNTSLLFKNWYVYVISFWISHLFLI